MSRILMFFLPWLGLVLLDGCSLVIGNQTQCDPEDDFCPAGTHCDGERCVPDEAIQVPPQPRNVRIS